MLSPELIKEIKKIQLKAGHLASNALAGEYLSAFRGLGMEFDEVREYVPGDDVRTIDWNVTAKTNSPHIKVFREEREMTLMLVVDVSSSQFFGTGGKFKSQAAAELAAVLAFLAIKNNDKVGLIVFSDHVEKFIPPKKGRAHVWRIIREILGYKARGEGTDIKGALEYLSKVQKTRSMCFLISDFIAEGYEQVLSVVSNRHELVCVKISDKREETLPNAGVVEVVNPETGEVLLLDTSDKDVQEAYRVNAEVKEKELEGMLNKKGAGYFSIMANDSVVMPLMKFMKKRERRLRL